MSKKNKENFDGVPNIDFKVDPGYMSSLLNAVALWKTLEYFRDKGYFICSLNEGNITFKEDENFPIDEFDTVYAKIFGELSSGEQEYMNSHPYDISELVCIISEDF